MIPRFHREINQLLVRNAHRDDKRWLGTAKPFASMALHYMPPPYIKPYPAAERNTGPRPVAGVGAASAILVNGIFGDPLLHLRLSNRKRSLLFDLGEGGRLPARIAHQVTDVFVAMPILIISADFYGCCAPVSMISPLAVCLVLRG